MSQVQQVAQTDYGCAFHKTSCQTRGLFQSFSCHINKARVYTPPRLLFDKETHPSYRLPYKLCKTMEQTLCHASKLDIYKCEQMHIQAFTPAPFCSHLGSLKASSLAVTMYLRANTHTHAHTRARRGPRLRFLNTVKLPLTQWQRWI